MAWFGEARFGECKVHRENAVTSSSRLVDALKPIAHQRQYEGEYQKQKFTFALTLIFANSEHKSSIEMGRRRRSFSFGLVKVGGRASTVGLVSTAMSGHSSSAEGFGSTWAGMGIVRMGVCKLCLDIASRTGTADIGDFEHNDRQHKI